MRSSQPFPYVSQTCCREQRNAGIFAIIRSILGFCSVTTLFRILSACCAFLVFIWSFATPRAFPSKQQSLKQRNDSVAFNRRLPQLWIRCSRRLVEKFMGSWLGRGGLNDFKTLTICIGRVIRIFVEQMETPVETAKQVPRCLRNASRESALNFANDA